MKEPVDCHYLRSFSVLSSPTCKNQNIKQKFPSRTSNRTKDKKKSLKAENKFHLLYQTEFKLNSVLYNLAEFKAIFRARCHRLPHNSFRNASSFGTIQQRWKAAALCELYWADKCHKILLYQFVLIVLEGTSLWKRIDFYVFSQRVFNSLRIAVMSQRPTSKTCLIPQL